jgi:hypothetical protein
MKLVTWFYKSLYLLREQEERERNKQNQQNFRNKIIPHFKLFIVLTAFAAAAEKEREITRDIFF